MHLHDADFPLLEHRLAVAEVISPEADELLGMAECPNVGQSLTECLSPAPQSLGVVG
jgi:hypothetical protein